MHGREAFALPRSKCLKGYPNRIKDYPNWIMGYPIWIVSDPKWMFVKIWIFFEVQTQRCSAQLNELGTGSTY